jgi:hypothetical protein
MDLGKETVRNLSVTVPLPQFLLSFIEEASSGILISRG